MHYYTPDTVHEGRVEQARQRLQAILNACHARHPHRYRNKLTAPAAPSPAGINYKTSPVTNSLIHSATDREGNTATRHPGGRDFRLARPLVLSALARIGKYGRRFLSGYS